MQPKQHAWTDQWSRFKDDSVFLFTEWIYPNTLEDFKGKRVLDAGCGHGHHLLMVAPYAKEAVGADLNTASIAREETKQFPHIKTIEGDIATLTVDQLFDVVYCIGVIQHTDDPHKTFQNLKALTKPGGRLIVWAYSYEGNFLNRTLVEGFKRTLLKPLPSSGRLALSYILTALLYPVVWSIYLLPLKPVLPYYEYFGNFRKLGFRKNVQNVFDKLIAPQTAFLKREEIERWFNPKDFTDIHISYYKGVSWRGSGTKR
jgi:SAM-dependent methyltransferase